MTGVFVKKLYMNKCVSNLDVIDVETNENSPNGIECESESHEDSMSRFMDNEEHLDNDEENENYLDSKAINSNAKKYKKKFLFGAPSENDLLTLLHASNDFSCNASCLVNEKGFKCLLTGRENNYPLDHRFSVSRCLRWHHLALDAPTFICNERALLLCLISQSCTNSEDSHKKCYANHSL